jgi:hypothetical protein
MTELTNYYIKYGRVRLRAIRKLRDKYPEEHRQLYISKVNELKERYPEASKKKLKNIFGLAYNTASNQLAKIHEKEYRILYLEFKSQLKDWPQ